MTDIGPRGPRGPQGEPGKYEALHKWRWTALAIWVVAFTASVLVLYHNNGDRIAESKHLIEQINAARAESCLRTYQAITIVLLLELKEKKADNITAEERKKLNSLVSPLQCRKLR